jgi:hypothetical protein
MNNLTQRGAKMTIGELKTETNQKIRAIPTNRIDGKSIIITYTNNAIDKAVKLTEARIVGVIDEEIQFQGQSYLSARTQALAQYYKENAELLTDLKERIGE